jgi:Domain of unknown function (DUF4123)
MILGQALMSDTTSIVEALRSIAADPAQRVYVLMDGARFEDLPGNLASAGLSHRSLYRNVQDAELVRAGPWLVDPYRQPELSQNAWGGLPPAGGHAASSGDAVAIDTEAALQELASGKDYAASADAQNNGTDPQAQLALITGIAADLPAAVFWIGDAAMTEARLWRHLRTLNMVLIPKGYGEEDAPPPAESDEAHEAVMFRHADGNVLAEVLPVLDAAQFSRVFGPARALMFLAPDHPASDGSTLRRALLPDDVPQAPVGMLKLSMEQMEGIEGARYVRLQKRTAEYLMRVGADKLEGRSDAALRRDADLWLQSGMAYGVKSECALWQWSYLQLYTRGRLTEVPGLHDYMKHAPGRPDDKVDIIMNSAIARLQKAA